MVCCVLLLEYPRRGDSNEYTQYTNVYKIEKISLNYRHLLPDLAACLTLSGSNYPYLEHIFMVPKMFEPLKLVCICTALELSTPQLLLDLISAHNIQDSYSQLHIVP